MSAFVAELVRVPLDVRELLRRDGCHRNSHEFRYEEEERGFVVPLASIVFGIVLIALGAEGYTNALNLFNVQVLHAKTSLIPAYFGVALVLLGILAYKPNLRKHMMHVAAMIGLLGAGAGLGMGLRKVLAGEANAAAKMQAVMGGICLLFLILCVKSFIDARRRRAQAQ